MDIRAIVDRFEDGKAILLVGEQEIAVTWPRELLPKCGESDILAIQISVDTDATLKAKQEAERLLAQLIRQNSSANDK
jgi:hypothetical protein